MTGGQRFKALLFDFDDTLVPEYEAADVALRELCAEVSAAYPAARDLESIVRETSGRLIHESPVGSAAIKALGPGFERWLPHELMWEDKAPMSEIAPHLEGFRRAVWLDAFQSSGIADTDLAQQLAERLPVMVHERRVPYPDAETVLKTLSQRHSMALVTNGEPPVQALKVENSGLKHHFQHVVLCHEHRAKPDPLPFNIAMGLLGCESGEVAMIGNSIANDIAGARNAGIFSIWINRDGSAGLPDEQVQPDVTVQELSQLLALL